MVAMFLRSTHQYRRRYAFAAVVMLLLGGLILTTFTPMVWAAPTEVRPSNLQGWGSLSEGGTPPPADFTAGPATPPVGSGSARLRTPAAADGVILGTAQFTGLRLDAITELSYSTYRVTPVDGVLAPALQINIDYDLTDMTTTWQGRLIYEPYQTPGNTVEAAVWQTWNALDGEWWASGAPGNTVCTQATTCTWEDVLEAFPNAGVQTGILSGVLFKAGSNWAGYEGHVDNVVITTTTEDLSFDFEAETLCTSLCYVDGTNGDDSFGGDTPTSALRTIQAALNRVDPNGTVIVSAGTYAEALTITKNGVTLAGAGAGTNPAEHTIVAGPVAGNSGIRLANANTIGVTISDLRVQNFTGGGICSIGAGNNNLAIERVHAVGNTTGAGCLGGIYVNGPISNVTISDSLAENNASRGIVIWNGFKQNIAITNNVVRGNNCCGIELQDGTASGVTITGNTIENNSDNGIGVVGLMRGAGPNLIANNTLTDNGRFGIEIKLSDGTGLPSGDGSIVVENNTVTQSASFVTLRPSEVRDLAGIAVFRRGWVAGANNVDLPAGVVVRNNTVSGYIQDNGASVSEGFGIVVEGLNHMVTGNTLTNNDVGVQRQAGHLPYTANTNIDGNQANLADQYFGRGNAPVTCGVTVADNTFTGNGVATRDVGGDLIQDRLVINTDTNHAFCSIQAAVDSASTLDGHTLDVSPGTFVENVTLNKALTLNGPNAGINPNTGVRSAEAVVLPAAVDLADGNIFTISADNVMIDGFTIDGDNPDLTSSLVLNGVDVDAGRGIANGTTGSFGLVQALDVRNNRVRNLALAGVVGDLTGGAASTGNQVVANQFDNMPQRSPNARAVLLRNNFYADVTDNVITRAFIGVEASTFDAAGAAAQISRNTISAYRLGIVVAQHTQDASAFSITDNSMTTADYAAWSVAGDADVPFAENSHVGLWLAALEDAVVVPVEGNSITGAHTGIQVENVPTSAEVTVRGGTLIDNAYGIAFVNCSPEFGPAQASALTIDGVQISGSTVAGVYVHDDTAANGCAGAGALDLAITGATTISAGGQGLWVRGANSTTTIADTSFSGQSGEYITLEGNANDIDARAAQFAGRLGRELDAAAYATVQAKLTDRNDDPALGLIILADATLTATPATLNYSSVVGGPNPADQTLTLQNAPAASETIAAWEIAAVTYGPEAADWLTCTPTSGGPLAAGASVDITCAVVSTELAAGIYSAEIALAATDPNSGSVQIFPNVVPVTLTVQPDTLQPAPQLSVTPGALAFSAVVGAPLPAAQIIQVGNAADAGADLNWTLSGVPNWLTCTPLGATLAPGATADIACRPNTTATVGALNATLTISSATPGVINGTQSVTVSYVVTSGPPPQFQLFLPMAAAAPVSSAELP